MKNTRNRPPPTLRSSPEQRRSRISQLICEAQTPKAPVTSTGEKQEDIEARKEGAITAKSFRASRAPNLHIARVVKTGSGEKLIARSWDVPIAYRARRDFYELNFLRK